MSFTSRPLDTPTRGYTGLTRDLHGDLRGVLSQARTQLDEVHAAGADAPYSAANASGWAGSSPPTTLAAAIDRLVAGLNALGNHP